MVKLLKNLFAMWLAMALCFAPLPVFAVQPAADDGEPCPMHAAANGDAQSVGQHNLGPAGGDCPHCKHCKKGSCSEEGCASGHCATVNLHPGITSDVGISLSRSTDIGIAVSGQHIVSRNDPPLLRPPL